MRELPSACRVRELFDYDPMTGIFRRRGGARAGQSVGSLTPLGYWMLYVDGQQYAAHRIAWVHFHGVPPADQVDHIDCDRSNNRLGNLREANNALNSANKGPNKNNSHGTKGVTLSKGRWQAQIKINYRNHYLGLFNTAEEAGAAYLAKAREVFGEFARASCQ